jgi:hypothetical protein
MCSDLAISSVNNRFPLPYSLLKRISALSAYLHFFDIIERDIFAGVTITHGYPADEIDGAFDDRLITRSGCQAETKS